MAELTAKQRLERLENYLDESKNPQTADDRSG